MMTPLGSSQPNNLQLCVTDSTATTLQSHNLDSAIEKYNTFFSCSDTMKNAILKAQLFLSLALRAKGISFKG